MEGAWDPVVFWGIVLVIAVLFVVGFIWITRDGSGDV